MKIKVLVCLCLVALLAGCDRINSAADKSLPLVESGPMRAITLAQWPNIREQYQGRVLVVDLWASWCVSCLERFPAMVEMSKQYRQSGVQFISLNMDDPGDRDSLRWSNDFLLKKEADFPHYHLNENLMKSFAALELLGIPVVLIYNAEGKERFRLTGDNPNQQFDDDDVDIAIKSLL